MKKRVLIFHPALAPYRVDQLNALSDQFDVLVVFLYENVWNHPFDQKKLVSRLRCRVKYLLHGPSYRGRCYRFGVLSVIRSFSPDVVIGYEYSLTTQYLLFLKTIRLLRVPVATTIDDSIDICMVPQSLVRKLARTVALRLLDKIIVLSEQVGRYYKHVHAFEDDNIIVSPILQDAQRLRSRVVPAHAKSLVSKYNLQGMRVLLFVGRLIPEKGLVQFIESVKSVLLANRDLIFVIVGSGPESLKLLCLVKQFRLDDQIVFAGRHEEENLYSFYSISSGFVLPSTYEPFGAVVNEALIFGLPVFCSSRAGSSSYIVEGKGKIFDPSNADRTAELFQCFVADLAAVKSDVFSRPSLMSTTLSDYSPQWEKLI